MSETITVTAADITVGDKTSRFGCIVEEIKPWPAGSQNLRQKLPRWSSDRFGTGRTTDRGFCEYRLTDTFEIFG